MATGLGGEPGESWEEIGKRIEQRTKSTLGEWAGAEPEEDWEALGRRIEDRIKSALRDWLNE
jgi:hypothetical protein